jgi:DNA (cytosine-5)-methyltransferase 1
MVGGFPCQDLSVAGQRKGFTGERSVLAFEFLRIAEAIKPRWLVFENVPGLLSSNKGLDFQRLLSEVAACGYGVGYRCLDARYFGVPQRRRRIFIVARRAEANINPRVASGLALRALCESGSGDITSCVPPWQDTTRTVDDGAGISGSFRSTASFGQWVEDENAGTLARRDYKSPNQLVSFYSTGGSQKGFWATDGVSPTLKVGSGLDIASPVAIAFGHTQGIDIQPSETHTPTLRVGGNGAAVAYSLREDASANTFSATEIDAARCLQKHQPSVQSHHAQTFIAQPPSIVRKLTPTECEALMGWPRNWTAPDGIKAPDSRRYAACGDGIVANVAYWIAQRIKMIESEQT